MLSAMRVMFMMAALGMAGAACTGTAEQDEALTPAGAEDDVVASVRLEGVTSSAALSKAIADAGADTSVALKVETFRFDAAKDPARVIAAIRSKLTHAKLRVDEGAVDAKGVLATLAEYEVTDATHQSAITAAIHAEVGARATTRKLWLRSDDVPSADAEWAEIVLVFVASEKGEAVSLTLHAQQ